jgi:hypothetical protein
MRGMDESTGVLFSYVDLEARVRPDHPLRAIRTIANAALTELQGEFAAMYAPRLGRLWIPPEKLLRAMLLQAFYSLRSEHQLMERLKYDLLFRWFVGLGVDDGGRAGEDEVPGPRPGRLGLRLQRGRLQPGAPAKAHGGGRLRAKGAAVAKAFAGRWRSVEMDVWESDFLALVAEAHLTVRGAGDGAIALGALAGQLDVRYGTREGSALKERKLRD